MLYIHHGIKQDIKDSLKKFDITKINGQLTNKDMNELTQELGAMLAAIPTTSGGGLRNTNNSSPSTKHTKDASKLSA